MGKENKDKIGRNALGVMTDVLKRQEDGTTLKKWKRETYKELLENVSKLPKDQRVHRIVSRLRIMIEKDEQWEKNAQEEEEKKKEKKTQIDTENVNVDSQVAHALGSAMLSGVMENNRKLHTIRRELLEDIENLVKSNKSYRVIINHIKRILLR